MRISLFLFALGLTVVAGETENSQTATPPAASPQDPAKPADPAPPPAPPLKYNGWVFSIMADGYVTKNFNTPASNFNQLQNFDLTAGHPELSMAMFTVDKSDKVFGIHADIAAGETMRWIHLADPAAIDHKALRFVKQAYVILKPNNTHGTEFDFGKFVTSAGAEVIESNSNWNYTRSLLFAWAIPYYHFGIRTTTPVTKELNVGFQLVNAWNTTWGNNNMDNIGLTLGLTKKKFAYFANYYEGPNHQGTTKGKRNLFDTTLLLTPTGKFNAYINADFGRDNHITGGGGDSWYGVAGAARYQLTKQFAVAGRLEAFNDKDGFNTGTAQVLKEVTLTGEYKLNDHLIGRLEYRHDASDKPYFDRNRFLAVEKSMNTFTAGIIVLLGPWK